MINFYSIVKSDKQFKNPHYEKHGIKLPFRMCIASSSGSGKTNILMNLLVQMDRTFNQIVLCVKSKHEPLYEHMIDKLENVEVHEVNNSGDIPEIVEEKKKSRLIVFDDLMLEKKDVQDRITQFYIRGRKFGYSCVYISQSFYQIDYRIRKNCQYFILGRGLLNKDLKLILALFNANISQDEFVRIYRECTDQPMHTMLIDLEKKTIRHNITEIIAEL